MKKLKWYYKHGTTYEIFSVLFEDNKFILVMNDETKKYSFGLTKDFGTLFGFPINQSCLTLDELKEQLNAFIKIDEKYHAECPDNWFIENITRWQNMIKAVTV